jgi:hypothetical protein
MQSEVAERGVEIFRLGETRKLFDRIYDVIRDVITNLVSIIDGVDRSGVDFGSFKA